MLTYFFVKKRISRIFIIVHLLAHCPSHVTINLTNFFLAINKTKFRRHRNRIFIVFIVRYCGNMTYCRKLCNFSSFFNLSFSPCPAFVTVWPTPTPFDLMYFVDDPFLFFFFSFQQGLGVGVGGFLRVRSRESVKND